PTPDPSWLAPARVSLSQRPAFWHSASDQLSRARSTQRGPPRIGEAYDVSPLANNLLGRSAYDSRLLRNTLTRRLRRRSTLRIRSLPSLTQSSNVIQALCYRCDWLYERRLIGRWPLSRARPERQADAAPSAQTPAVSYPLRTDPQFRDGSPL